MKIQNNTINFCHSKYENKDKLRPDNKKITGQVLSGDEFFINMTNYGKNYPWEKCMQAVTYNTSKAISKGIPFSLILKYVEFCVNQINMYLYDFNKDYGVKRKCSHCFRVKIGKRGTEYYERYYRKINALGESNCFNKDITYSPKPNKENKNANTCQMTITDWYFSPVPVIDIFNEEPKVYKISNLSLAKKEYKRLKKIKNPTLKDIMRTCATIQWLIAQETPYLRGSDSIANILTKSIMHAYNIRISPVKEGVSLDFEAFDTDLDEYIEKYPDFFKEKPCKIIT